MTSHVASRHNSTMTNFIHTDKDYPIHDITRVEVVDGTGYSYVAWDISCDFSVQDDGRTLKVSLTTRDNVVQLSKTSTGECIDGVWDG